MDLCGAEHGQPNRRHGDPASTYLAARSGTLVLPSECWVYRGAGGM
jgi:hypothetical protein